MSKNTIDMTFEEATEATHNHIAALQEQRKIKKLKDSVKEMHDFITLNKHLLWGNGVDPILRRSRMSMKANGIEYDTFSREIEARNEE